MMSVILQRILRYLAQERVARVSLRKGRITPFFAVLVNTPSTLKDVHESRTLHYLFDYIHPGTQLTKYFMFLYIVE